MTVYSFSKCTACILFLVLSQRQVDINVLLEGYFQVVNKVCHQEDNAEIVPYDEQVYAMPIRLLSMYAERIKTCK